MMTSAGKHPPEPPWYGPSSLLPEIVLFFGLVTTVATYATRDAQMEAAATGVCCGGLSASMLLLSWRRCSFGERLWSLLLGAACIVLILVAWHNISRLAH